MSSELVCIVRKFPTKYLGLHVGANPSWVKTWESVLEKIKAKLAIWKGKLLAQAGRLTLIKSDLNNLPIYYLGPFRISMTIAKKIRQLERGFFGEVHERRKGTAIIKWEIIERPKSCGALGVH